MRGMTVRQLWRVLFGVLRSLPLIRIGLALGGAIMASLSQLHNQLWILHGRFPDDPAIWLARLQGSQTISLINGVVVVVVLVALAFGRAGKLGVKAGGVEVELDFDNSDQPGDRP